MPTSDELRGRARATWAAGNWDRFARLIAPVGERVLERAELEPGMDLLDVGTGSGGNIVIPAALGGAKVVGRDVRARPRRAPPPSSRGSAGPAGAC